MKARVLDPGFLLFFRCIRLILARTVHKLRKLDPALALHILVYHQAVYTHRVKVSIKVKHLVRVDFRDLYRNLLLDEALALTSDIFFLKIEQGGGGKGGGGGKKGRREGGRRGGQWGKEEGEGGERGRGRRGRKGGAEGKRGGGGRAERGGEGGKRGRGKVRKGGEGKDGGGKGGVERGKERGGGNGERGEEEGGKEGGRGGGNEVCGCLRGRDKVQCVRRRGERTGPERGRRWVYD